MSVFATEFPVRADVEKATFAAAAVAWIRGINNSKVLQNADARELHDDEVWLETAEGETLSIKSFENLDTSVFGVRLEIPDRFGRRWRTECVYSSFGTQAFVRVRGQCVAIDPAAQIETPLKPHIIRQIIDDDWQAADGLFKASAQPIYLKNNDVEIAAAVLSGNASSFLPCIYISRTNQNKLPISADLLAKRLAGLCHIVVEPNRGFSFELMEASLRKNPYGGAIGLFSPDGRELLRAFKSSKDKSGRELSDYFVEKAVFFMSGLAAKRGWEWQQLQEAQSRYLREKVISQRSDELDEYINHFDAELRAKEEQIENLKTLLEIAKHEKAEGVGQVGDILQAGLKAQVGTELYDGEFSDRLRHYLTRAISTRSVETDTRTIKFVEKLVEATAFSGRAASLINQIKGACRDGNEMPKNLGSLLTGFGFTKSQEGKHLKFEPPNELFGLQTEILPSTPSDSQRGGKNRGAEVIKNFGLKGLK
ncbi:hypothetical protein [Ruegeria arenilitoris]|uniref:hypothetical protein n=1 Tax=Ruegeria arenilitoris TaxID=1173585 RepID=UPI0014807747|nr:hypothetical protein [Ruegeria arenilitoris]